MNEFNDNSGLDELQQGFFRPNDSQSVSHIGYIRGGYRTVPSASDIVKIHHSRLDVGQIIYALHESQSYIISQTQPTFFDPEPSASYAEFYFPTSGSEDSGVGVGFPYAGSDDQYGDPAQAIITGSLLLSGSGNITASNLTLAGNISSSGDIIANNLTLDSNLVVGGDTDLSGDLNVYGGLQVDSTISTENNLNVANNLDVGGTISFDGFTFSDGNISILSGSNIFGTSSLNTHQFTGSLLISGGPHLIQGNTQITGSLDISGSLLINGNPLDFSGVEDQEVFLGHIMINTGDFQVSGTYSVSNASNGFNVTIGSQDNNALKGNQNNQFAFTGSHTGLPGTSTHELIKHSLNPGDKVRIDWIHNDVSHSHTTHIFSRKETGGSDFNWLMNFEGTGGDVWNINPNSNPNYAVDYQQFEYEPFMSMSLHTGITASHWKERIESISLNYLNTIATDFKQSEFNKGYDGWRLWYQTNFDGDPYPGTGDPQKDVLRNFKLYKIIPGVPCCDPFADSFYNASDLPGGNIVIHGGITTIDGPIRADGELIADQGLTVKVPSNPHFHDIDKYTKGTDKPMATVKSASIEPIRVNDQGIFKMHNFTQADEDANHPTPQVGGIMFRNGEMYLGKE